jgi:formylglycine-generating enzyme
MNSWSRVLLLFATLLLATSASYADSFGSGANAFTIDFVTIGTPGNPADTTGDPNPAGSVPYTYRIGKYEVPEDAVRKANTLGGLGITLDSRGPNKPATSLSWFEAAKFVNWLNTSSGATPAYKFDIAGNFQLWAAGDPGYDPANLFRNTLARYFMPSADEWYKAAFYDPSTGGYWDYPTGSDSPPIAIASGTAPGTAVWNQAMLEPAEVTLSGGPSPFGTFGQAANVLEWEETELDLVNNNPGALRGARGGSWIQSISPLALSSSFRNSGLPTRIPSNVGLRIARTIPEPSCVFLGGASVILIALYRGRTLLGRS